MASLRRARLNPSPWIPNTDPSPQQQHHHRHSSSSSSSPSSLPLSGLTVISLEHAVAAPFCTRQLADLGARVIKIERPHVGDFARSYDSRTRGLASYFVWANRSKESIALDLKLPRSRRALGALVAGADVLVQNLAPGAASRMGLSYGDLKERHPRLVVCDISGYGSSGPYKDKKAYDLLVQSEAGVLSVTGGPDSPAKAGISIADISAGMYAYSGILAALLRRGTTGRGSHVDISMLEAMAEWMSYPLYYAFDGAPGPKRAGDSHGSIYPYGRFEVGKDGKEGSVMLGVQNEREWKALCEKVLGDAALATDPRFVSNSLRSENRDELKGIICAAFAGHSTEEVIAKLDGAGIANARVRDMAGLWAHEQLKARGRWTEVDTPAGRVPALLPPGVAGVEDARMDAVPGLGEHTEKILRELGMWEDEEDS